MAEDAQGYRGYGSGWRGFVQGVLLFDDELDRGVVGVGFSVEAVADGDELLAVAFLQALGAGFAGLEGFDNVHIVTGAVRSSRSLPQCWRFAQAGVGLRRGPSVLQVWRCGPGAHCRSSAVR